MNRHLNHVWLIRFALASLSFAMCATLQAQRLQTQPPAASVPDNGIVHQLMQRPAPPQESNSRIVIRAPKTETAVPMLPANDAPVLINAMRAPLRSDPQAAPLQQVRQAIYDPDDEAAGGWHRAIDSQPVSVVDPTGTEPESKSFIEREKAQPQMQRSGAQEMVAKISMNLAFVLALAIAVMLVARYWQKSKTNQRADLSATVDSLNVSQVLPLTGGASLHVVEGTQNKFLVAIDASGIKSVNVLVQSFEDTLQRSGAFDSTPTDPQLEPIEHDESTAEIDEKLIKLLLKSAKQAA